MKTTNNHETTNNQRTMNNQRRMNKVPEDDERADDGRGEVDLSLIHI